MSIQKIHFITDSACDIPEEENRRLFNLDILPIPLTVDGQGFYERINFTPDEFYKVLETSTDIPSTAHVLPFDFCEKYKEAYKKGCTHIIHVTIYSGASSMNDSAHLAKKMFFEDYPGAEIEIEIIDSNCYTMGYGYPLIMACKMAETGSSFDEVLAYIHDYLNRVEIYFSPFSLKYVKKSGRLSCTAAFVGELIGLRPIISAVGTTNIVEKVRGNNAVVPYIAKLFADRRDCSKGNSPYMILVANDNSASKELAAICEKEAKYPPKGIYKIGASITINTGPDIVGITFLGSGEKSK